MPMEATPSGLSRRILIVDDEDEIAGLLAEVLAQAGYGADTAPNGRAALDRLEAASYDVVIADVNMPELDGPGLYDALAQRQPQLAGRFVLFGGDTGSAKVRSFVERTGVLCVAKPFDPEAVLRIVRRLAG
jgi:two-component system NtrC family sensor kinase